MNIIHERVTELVDAEVEIELLANGFVFTEGPVWSFRDSHLTFSDIPGDTMYRWDEREGVREYRKPSNFSNGPMPISCGPMPSSGDRWPISTK